MNYSLIPRFYYTLPIKNYLSNLTADKTKLFYSKALFFNNARTALKLLLNSISDKQLNIGVQAYTCHTVFQAIHNAGHKMVFIDLNQNFQLDLIDIKNKLNQIDILIVTHTFGFPENMEEIKEIVHDKIIIEDCSHSFLSKYKNKYTGTLGDASIFSTGLGKFPPIGLGGFCMINHPSKFPFFDNFYAAIPKPKIYSSCMDFLKILVLSIMMKPPLYGLITRKLGEKLDSKLDLGNKYSFTESKAHPWIKRILNKNYSFIQKILCKNVENANLLANLINNTKTIIPDNIKESSPNYYIFPFLLENRNDIFNKFLANQIEPGKHFHKSILWASEFGYKNGDCPNTERLIEKTLTVPTHYGVRKMEISKMASIINTYAK